MGSPTPTGRLSALHSTTPPRESPSPRIFTIKSLILSCNFIWTTYFVCIPLHCNVLDRHRREVGPYSSNLKGVGKDIHRENSSQKLQSDSARHHKTSGYSAGESSPSPKIVETRVLHKCRIISVPRAWNVFKPFIIRASIIRVPN